jgi:hypothetical protein
MASLDSLPADQRAVLDLVLQRGRSYDEIAQMLSIDRAGVRQRALAAFDALGPQTKLDPIRRALITDYLLGQLPSAIRDQTRASLAHSPAERAWARVLASELAPLARDPLPEIPAAEPAREPEPAGAAVGAPAEPEPASAVVAAAAAVEPAGAAADERATAGEPPPPRGPRPRRRSSRRGGAILLGSGAVVAVAVVVVLIVALSGGSSKKHTSSTAARATTPTSSTSTTAARPIAQVNLFPPNGGSQAKGIAQIISANNALLVAIFATGVPANSHNAYAVWLYNSPTSSRLVGFVSPGVSSNGQLQTEGPLTVNPANYKQLLVTLETQAHPKVPGQVILQGTISIPAGR